MHLFCIGRIVVLHSIKWHGAGAAWCADTVTSDGDGELDSKKQDWGVDTGVKHGLYLFSTEIHVQGYLPPSKVALSFIQRVEFQTNKCLYGSSNDCGPNWRGAKRTTNKLSVFAQARARNTELPVLCCLNLSGGVPQSFILCFISCQGKARSKRFC